MFDDGGCNIYQLTDLSAPGDMPIEGLALYAPFLFEERKIGMTRNYLAMQDNNKIDRLIRIWQDRAIVPDNVCVINDGVDVDVQYRIARVEHLVDNDGLKITDLTLERASELYDVGDAI